MLKKNEPLSKNWDSMIAQYNAELMRYQKNATIPAVTPKELPKEPASVSAVKDEGETAIGYLQVQVFTAGGTVPVSHALLTITRLTDSKETLYGLYTTGSDGCSPVISLPAVSASLSLEPGAIRPYVLYQVQVNAEGFPQVRHQSLPIYAEVTAIQAVLLVPVPDIGERPKESVFVSGAPNEL